ncbi:MAG: Gfo/Idh/MocA family oxidoreductase [Deltaproteobacteria bacterium]|nr:MAG: Gfo/Idh/MocA family oxidoreductase [Deltaproteobacteria bacterium]
MSTSEILGVGLIGAGGIMHRHALAYLRFPDRVRLVAVSDIDPARAQAARNSFRMQAAYEDYRDLLARDDVHVVSVCTRPDTHAAAVLDAIDAGKHVLVEKPLARSLAEADDIIAACDRNPELRVSCLYQWRFDRAVQFASRSVEQDRLGRPLLADVHLRASPAPAYYDAGARRESWGLDGGGVLIVYAIHQLDLLISLLGNPVEVSGQMDTFVRPTEGEDTLTAWIRFESGALATLSCTACAHEGRFSIELVGEEASLRLSWERPASTCRWDVHASRGTKRRELAALGRREAPRPRLEPGRYTRRALEILHRVRGRPWLPPRHWWHTPYVSQYLDAIESGAEVPVPPREARRSLELVAAIYQSALTGSPVRLPLDAGSPVYRGVEAREIQMARGA